MENEIIKKISIVDTASSPPIPYSKDIGADAENIDVYRNAGGQIVSKSENPDIAESLDLTLQKIENTRYSVYDENEDTIEDTDYIPISNRDGTERKKTKWSNILEKVNNSIGIKEESTNNNFLREDGTWITPYTFETGNSNGQIKITSSRGITQNINVKGLNSAAYTPKTDYPMLNGSVTEIPATSTNQINLNSYITPGNYTCGADANSPYITNQPLTSNQVGFNLWVLKSKNNNAYFRQYLQYYNNNNFYTRYTTNTGSTWSTWINIASQNTWRPIENVLTSTSTQNSLSANQGRLLANGSARDNTKIPLTGTSSSTGHLTGQIQKAGGSVSWIEGRDTAITRMNSYKGTSTAPSYSAILSDKTLNGSWELGTYDNNNLYLTYCTDANYNSNNNVTSGQYIFKPNVSADLSKAIKSISVSGRAVTATHFDNTTNTINTQDTNTTYSAGAGLSLSGTAFSVKYGTVANTACQGNDSRLSNARTPVAHASTATTYGIGNASNYGHVKLTDDYTSTSAASTGIAASAKAVSNLNNSLGHELDVLIQNVMFKNGGAFTGNVTIAGGNSRLTLGNASNSGGLRIYNNNSSYVTLAFNPVDSNIHRTLYIPQTTKSTSVLITSEDLNYVVNQTSQIYMPKSGGTFTGTVKFNGTAQVLGDRLTLGTTAKAGTLRIYSSSSTAHYGDIKESAVKLTGNYTYSIPNSTGIIQVTKPSSRRVKENIHDITEEKVKKILDLNIVNFDYIDGFDGGGKDQVGVIAEDAIKIIPEAVIIPDNYDESKPIDNEKNPAPSVDYRQYIPYLIKMVQIQQKEIDELKAKINKEEK